jgi:hypothetical protein
LAIRVDDLAVAGDDAEAVAIAVESESEFGAARASASDDILQVLWLRRVGMMIRKIAVDLAEQLDELAAERAEELRGDPRRRRRCRSR